MSHSLIAILATVLAAALGHPWLGAASVIAFFAGREHAQAEHRWIKAFGGGLRANMPLWGGFDPRAWNADSALRDLALPSAAAILVALIAVTGLPL